MLEKKFSIIKYQEGKKRNVNKYKNKLDKEITQIRIPKEFFATHPLNSSLSRFQFPFLKKR